MQLYPTQGNYDSSSSSKHQTITSSGFRCLPNVLIKPSTLLNENEFLNFQSFHQTFSVFMPSKTHYWQMSDDHLIFMWKVTWEGWPSRRIFIPWITLTIMSYSYHIHIDQQSINKWKYQEILVQWIELLIMSRIVSLKVIFIIHQTNLHLHTRKW